MKRTGPRLSKAQLMSSDFVMSMVVFLTIMLLVGFLWSTVSTDLINKRSFDLMMLDALRSSELLVKNHGRPENWTASSVKVLGLAESENVLDDYKTREFATLVLTDYFKAKELLGLKNDFYFEVYDVKNDSVIYGAPRVSLDSYENVAVVTRLVLLNNTIMKMIFAVVK